MESYATAQQVYVAGLVFARIGAMVMLMPGLGESPAPARIRLSLALVLSILLVPIAAPTMP
ncbi:MAG TPA: flagellar biosynthetic protein FliR, partial [Phenylobacterium sp.]|nr:flagellar biosynthetic protein FliR [Phenylobacterium sp.]